MRPTNRTNLSQVLTVANMGLVAAAARALEDPSEMCKENSSPVGAETTVGFRATRRSIELQGLSGAPGEIRTPDRLVRRYHLEF